MHNALHNALSQSQPRPAENILISGTGFSVLPPPPTTSRVLMYCNDGSGYHSPTEITNSQ